MPPISPLTSMPPVPSRGVPTAKGGPAFRRPDGAAGAAPAGPGAAAAAGGAGSVTAGSRNAAAARTPPPLAEVVDQLAADIQRLRIDSERFWSGALPLPPEELRQRIQTQLRALRNSNGGTAVDRFRLGDLEARFNSYNELWNRRLRDREEGRRRIAMVSAAPPPRHDPAKGVVIGRSADPGAVAALYEGLAKGADPGAGPEGKGPRFDLATFGAYLERQAAAIREKTGCEEVHFRLAAEDGKLKLKARPLGGARG
jgi:hypothetical protein